MLGLIIGALTGLAGPISTVASKIIDLQAQKSQAQSSVQKAQIDEQIEAAHDRKAVLVAEAGNRLSAIVNSITRALMAIPVAAFLLKVFLWDKVIGSFAGCAGPSGAANSCITFRTDALDTNLWWVITAVIGFYFLYDLGTKLVSK